MPTLQRGVKGPSSSAARWPSRDLRRIGIFVVGYAAAFFYCYSARLRGTLPAPIWAPDAVLLCALLVVARRTWWTYLLVALLIRVSIAAAWTSPGFFLADYANDAVTALLAAVLLRRLKPEGGWFSTTTDFASFMSITVVGVPMLSAVWGAVSIEGRGEGFWRTWSEWFLGDSLSYLLLTPLILSFASSPPRLTRSRRRRVETGVLIVGLLASGTIAFRSVGTSQVAVLLCLPFPFLLWAAVRYGVRGASAALSLVALSGVWAVFEIPGSPGPAGLQATVLSLQLFLLVVGSSLLFLAVVLDERRAIEENLRSTQARLRRAEASSTVMVAHVGLDGRILRVSRKLASLLGRSRSELLGFDSRRLTHTEDRGPEESETRRLLAEEIDSFQLQKRFLKSDGTPVWFYLSRSVVRDADGKPLHFFDYLTDIDELKRAEAAARRSENELRLFAEHSPAAVAVLDEDLRFVMASRRFREDFQRDGQPIAGRRYDDALAGFPPRWPDAFRTALVGAGESAEEDTFTRPDGKTESLRWEIVPGVRLEGRPAGALLFAELTTDRKREESALEDLRRQLAHLMRASILGELSGALAHELAQPLAAILANAQAAQTYLTRGPDGAKEVASILEDIVADDLRAGDVIRSLRQFLRKGVPELRVIDLNDLIREALDLAHSDLITKSVSVGLELAANLPAIRGDRVQLQQVVLNLIVNACEAMAGEKSAGRNLRLETSLEEDNTVHLTVQDSGPGVAPEVRGRLFEPFLTTKSGGLGLGLTISRSIVLAHGGRLWQADVESGGASFHVAFPAVFGTG